MMKVTTIWGLGLLFTKRWLTAAVVLVLTLLPASAVSAQPKPPGDTESANLVEAHRGVDTARLDVDFATYYSYPDETDFLKTSYTVLLDRANNRVRIDRPGYTLLCDGKDFVLVAEALPGRHLRLPLEGDLTFAKLAAVYPDLVNPTPPGLMMLLAEKPMLLLSDGLTEDATPMGLKQVGGQALRSATLPMQLGTCTLSADPVSKLMKDVHIEVDPRNLAGTAIKGVHFHYKLAWSEVDQPIDPSVFELDLKRSHEMTSLAQFLAVGPVRPGGVGAAGGGQAPTPGGGGGVAPTLVGMPLPDLELAQLGSDEKINLIDQDKGVVIVEFFASWTKPSTLDLPALTDFKTWCQEEKKDVAIFAVAVGETKESMTPWIDALEKTAKKEIDLPVLLDTTTDAAMAMKLPTVPRTIIAVDGRVVDVYGGTKPNLLADLKQGLADWEAAVKPSDEDEADQPVDEEPAEESTD